MAGAPPTATELLSALTAQCTQLQAQLANDIAAAEARVAALEEQRTGLQAELAARRAEVERELEALRAAAAADRDQQQQAVDAARARLEEEKAAMARVCAQAGDVIELNVSGEIMAAQRSTLCLVEESMLASMFSGRWEDRLPKDQQGRVFLDWNAYATRKVLDFLRLLKMGVPGAEEPPLPKVAPDMEVEFTALVKYLNLDAVMHPPPPPFAPAKFVVGANVTLSDNDTVATAAVHSWGSFVVAEGEGFLGTGRCAWKVTIRSGTYHMIGVIRTSELPAARQPGPYLYNRLGLYFNTANGALYSGPPYNHGAAAYAGRAFSTAGTVIEVVLDCPQRTLSFTANGTDLGVAYRDLDVSQPFTLCCVLYTRADSVAYNGGRAGVVNA